MEQRDLLELLALLESNIRDAQATLNGALLAGADPHTQQVKLDAARAEHALTKVDAALHMVGDLQAWAKQMSD